MVNLILTNSYYNLFPTLVDLIKPDVKSLSKRNVIFCEAKISLMVERFICGNLGGSFNTDVYSFGSFLRSQKKIDSLLSKEGSAMAVKNILTKTELKCFKHGKTNLSAALYELIMQLKSAKITPEDTIAAAANVSGVLKNKLSDIATVYSLYEKFITERGLDDQSSLLSYLPDVIYNSEIIKEANVYVVGYSGFTAQMRTAIEALMDNAKSFTAILTEGQNPHLFVNETADFIRRTCKAKNYPILVKNVNSDYCFEAEVIEKNLFSPTIEYFSDRKDKANIEACKINTDKIYVCAAKNPEQEILHVGEIIKRAVIEGKCRYRDISIAVSNSELYKDAIKHSFSALNIPYFLDEQKIPESHPVITLITAYIDAKRRGFERSALLSFVKNPLFCEDKALSDEFENYLIKYNINYSRIFTPFTFDGQEIKNQKLESLRQSFCALFEKFSVRNMLLELSVEQKLEELSERLEQLDEKEEAAISRQIYQAVINILDEMALLLGKTEMSYSEYKNTFLSGVSALRLSIIPQYNDAVFVGGFKEVALAKAKRLFVIGLTADVPSVKEDVAVLTDRDIAALEQIKVLVEPKIRVVNHRMREQVGMGVSAFKEELYLSYPLFGVDGKRNLKSEVLNCVEKLFTVNAFPQMDGYLTKSQGLASFAKACGEFAEGERSGNFSYDFTTPSSYSAAVGVEQLKPLLDRANKEIKQRLNSGSRSYAESIVSPTTIEHYYQCPYRAFLEHGLKIKSRDEGRVDALSVGNLMHEIFKKYVKEMAAVSDKDSSDALFDKVKSEVLEDEAYKKFLSDNSTKAAVNRVLNESKGYCYKTYQTVSQSSLTNCKTEVGFGEDRYYPAISLAGGKVKLKGKIDRVDEGDKYFRIIDYKTGKADADEKLLFAGVKLQLYLYAEAVRKKYEGAVEKTPVGLYYLPVSDKYSKKEDKDGCIAVGKTVTDEQAVEAQEKGFMQGQRGEVSFISTDKRTGKVKGVSQTALTSYIDYAVEVADLAVQRIGEGVIVASPYEKACEYCPYHAMCDYDGEGERTVGSVNEKTFDKDAVGGQE